MVMDLGSAAPAQHQNGTAFAYAASNLITMKLLTRALFITTALTGGVMLTRCSNTPEEQKDTMNEKMNKVEDKMEDAKMDAKTPAAWESERTSILNDLRDLRSNIDNKLSSTNEKLAGKGLKPSERKDEEAMKAELEKEKAAVDEQITKVEGADAGTWETVKADSKKASDDVKGWWGRLKENVDKKTSSDKDHDGH